jgi:hypothetical protein
MVWQAPELRFRGRFAFNLGESQILAFFLQSKSPAGTSRRTPQNDKLRGKRGDGGGFYGGSRFSFAVFTLW